MDFLICLLKKHDNIQTEDESMPIEWMDYLTLGVAFVAAGASVWAAVATYHAAKSARDSADVSAQQLRNQIKEQERIERPRLIPLNTIVLPHPSSVLSDWRTPKSDAGLIESKEDELVNDNFIKLPTRFSNVEIPIINAGKSFAIDIIYTLSLAGDVNSIIEYDSEFAKLSLAYPRSTTDPDEMFSIHVITYNNFEHMSSNNEKNQETTLDEVFLVRPHERHISILESSKKNKIFIPSYFVVLFNIYHKEFYSNSNREDQITMPMPQLKLKIEYNDQYSIRYIDEYYMELSTKQFNSTSYHPKFEAWVDFKHISSSSIPNKQK